MDESERRTRVVTFAVAFMAALIAIGMSRLEVPPKGTPNAITPMVIPTTVGPINQPPTTSQTPTLGEDTFFE